MSFGKTISLTRNGLGGSAVLAAVVSLLAACSQVEKPSTARPESTGTAALVRNGYPLPPEVTSVVVPVYASSETSKPSYPFCTAVLLGPRIALTVARCASYLHKIGMKLRVGPERVGVDRVLYHNDFSDRYFVDSSGANHDSVDIAILNLATPLLRSDYAELDPALPSVGAIVRFAGAGDLADGQWAQKAYGGDLRVNGFWKGYFPTLGGLTPNFVPHQMSASRYLVWQEVVTVPGPQGHSTCPGDVGGPLYQLMAGKVRVQAIHTGFWVEDINKPCSTSYESYHVLTKRFHFWIDTMRTLFSQTGSSSQERFIKRVYAQTMGRYATPAEVAAAKNELLSKSRTEWVAGLFNTVERQTIDLTFHVFLSLLGRTPSDAEKASLISEPGEPRISLNDKYAVVASGPEFFQKALAEESGPTASHKYVQSLSRYVLGRAFAGGELQTHVNELNSYGDTNQARLNWTKAFMNMKEVRLKCLRRAFPRYFYDQEPLLPGAPAELDLTNALAGYVGSEAYYSLPAIPGWP